MSVQDIGTPNMEFSQIPPEVQKMYNIGETVQVVVTGSVRGGDYAFKNQKGETIRLGARDLRFWGIRFRGIPN